ncbi:ATP-binding cassette domain-containing protein, partial [Deinococcus pimensis]|uniref:ATP-binding cassette domain-containing protein n=1 Tax=Deinococcus pimensis TaxID=309888 RepID=UPI0004839F5E
MSTTAPPALRFEDVTVRFGDFTALDGVTFEVPHGAFLAVVGPNGAGKSTLMRTALGLVTPTRGRALVYGETPGHAARRVGYVPQIKTFDRSFPAQAVE